MSILRSFVGSDIRDQARIPGDMEEVVRDGKEGRAVERKHGRIFGIVVGGRQRFGLSDRAGVHVLYRGDLSAK